MSHYPFGKDFTRALYSYDATTQPIQLPSQTPTIYIFSSEPNRTEAAAGTGAIQTISSWTIASTTPYAATYTVTAIDDPEPTGAVAVREYWEAINYIAKTAGQVQTKIRSFEIGRIAGGDSFPSLGTSLTDLYPAITAYLTTDQITQFASLAREEMRLELRAKGIEWEQVSGLNDTYIGLAYKTIALAVLSQIKEQGDRHEIRYREFSAKYEAFMSTLKLPYDEDGDGSPDTTVTPIVTQWVTIR